MADARAIYQVSDAFKRVLQENLSLLSITASQIFIESIDLLPDPIPRPRLTVFLYNISENPFLKNRDHQVISSVGGTSQQVVPPCVVDLDFMVCAWAASTTDEHQLLGDVLRVMYDHAELEPVYLGAGWDPADTVQLSLHNPSIEDQARIWTTFGFKRFKLALYYKARVIPIASQRVFTSGIVQERSNAPHTIGAPNPSEVPPEVPLP